MTSLHTTHSSSRSKAASAGDAGGGYNTNFVDITTPPQHIIVSGSGDVTTNYTDSGGATNPSRFYRIRLVP